MFCYNLLGFSDHLSFSLLGFTVLVLLTTGFLLFLHFLILCAFRLEFVDSFDQDFLVLELVTFGGKVESVVDVLVDLLGFSVFSEQSSQNTLSSDPQNFFWHTGVQCTLSFTCAGVSTKSLLFEVKSCSGSGVDLDASLHDETILDEFSETQTYSRGNLGN